MSALVKPFFVHKKLHLEFNWSQNFELGVQYKKSGFRRRFLATFLNPLL